MGRRLRRVLTLATVLGLLSAACGDGGGRSCPKANYPLYVLADTTGPFGNIGQPPLSAFKGFADYTNKHDGVKQAVSGGALTVPGVNDSNAWSPSASLLQQNQIPTSGSSPRTLSAAPTDVSSQASAVAASKPDVVIAEVTDTNAPLAVKTLRDKGYSGSVVTFSAASAPATFAMLKDPSYYGQVHFLVSTWTDQPAVADVGRRAQRGRRRGLPGQRLLRLWLGRHSGGGRGTQQVQDGSLHRPKLNDALNNLGKGRRQRPESERRLQPEHHHLAWSRIYNHWDASKSAPGPVGTWIPVNS